MGEVEVYREGDEYVAWDGAALVQAFGATEAEARANLEADRRDHFAELLEYDRTGHLSNRLRKVLVDCGVVSKRL